MQFIELPQGSLALNIFHPKELKGDAILVHGFTGSKEDFDYIAPLLADRGYRVFALDNRAQHESPIAESDDAYTIDAHAQDVFELARHFNLSNVHLFGHSFGGVVAQRAYLLDPTLYKSLTLFCTGPSAMSQSSFAAQMKPRLHGKTMQQAWDEFAEEMYLQHPRRELMKKRWLANDPRALIVQAGELSTFTSVIDLIAEKSVSAHVIYGERDDAWPLEAQDQMARDLNARLSIIKDAGHCPNEDQPEVTAKVIADFWDQI